MLNRYRDTGKGEVFLCILWWYTAGSTFICVRASLVSSFHLLYLLWIWKVWPHGFTWYFCIKLHLIKKNKIGNGCSAYCCFFSFLSDSFSSFSSLLAILLCFFMKLVAAFPLHVFPLRCFLPFSVSLVVLPCFSTRFPPAWVPSWVLLVTFPGSSWSFLQASLILFSPL